MAQYLGAAPQLLAEAFCFAAPRGHRVIIAQPWSPPPITPLLLLRSRAGLTVDFSMLWVEWRWHRRRGIWHLCRACRRLSIAWHEPGERKRPHHQEHRAVASVPCRHADRSVFRTARGRQRVIYSLVALQKTRRLDTRRVLVVDVPAPSNGKNASASPRFYKESIRQIDGLPELPTRLSA